MEVSGKISWDELDELIKVLQEAKLPEEPMKLDKATTITNPRGFVNAHISILLGNRGRDTYLPYLKRLLDFRNLIQKL